MQIIYIEFSDHLRVDQCCSSEREIFSCYNYYQFCTEASQFSTWRFLLLL